MRKLDLTGRAAKFIHTLPPKQFRQVVTKLFGLMKDPEPPDSKVLAGYPYRRADIGEYRIIYRTAGDVLKVALVGKRNDDAIYRELARLSE